MKRRGEGSVGAGREVDRGRGAVGRWKGGEITKLEHKGVSFQQIGGNAFRSDEMCTVQELLEC